MEEIKNLGLESISSKDIEKVQDFILDIWKDYFELDSKEEELNRSNDLLDPLSYYENRNGNFWCVKSNGQIVATIAIHEIEHIGKRVGFLRRCYVSKHLRGKGIGGNMLSFVEEYSILKKWEYVLLSTDESMNVLFYKKRGYKKISKNIPDILSSEGDTVFLKKNIIKHN